MSRRILVLAASVGAGHLRAAQAVELALRRLDPDAAIENYDVLEFTNATFRRLYGVAYLDMVNKARTSWATFTTCSTGRPRPNARPIACGCWSNDSTCDRS